MSVYVDNALIPYGRMLMSHLIADSVEELHDMADKLGLKREWFQGDALIPHYDVCMKYRDEAIGHGAIPVDYSFMRQKVREATGRSAPDNQPTKETRE